MGHARALFAVAVAAAAAASCAQVLGARFDAPPIAQGDGASDASPDGEVCIDDPPPKDATEAGTDLQLVFAMRCLNFGDGVQNAECAAATTPGFNLDSACQAQCSPPHAVAVNPCCVDNGLRDLLSTGQDSLTQGTGSIAPNGGTDFSSDALSTGMDRGVLTVLLRIGRYNGSPDDPDVDLDWFVSIPWTDAVDAGSFPSWNGLDPWGIATRSLLPDAGPDGGVVYDLGRPRWRSSSAYVSGRELVARFDQAELVMAPIELPLLLHQVRLRARLEAKGVRWTLREGLLGASIEPSELLEAFGRTRTREQVITELCPGYIGYAVAIQRFCEGRDLGPPGSACTMISGGATFYAESAATPTVTKDYLTPWWCEGQPPGGTKICD
jgi:hypothetical protein